MKKRWFQYRLRSLAFLVLVAAVGLSLYRQHVGRRILKVVQDKAKSVWPEPKAKAWLWIFDDSIFKVQQLSFEDKPQFTDQDAIQVAKLSRLRRLVLKGTSISPAAAKPISKLSNLSTLSLDGTQTDDAAVAEYAELKGLKDLGLSRTEITDAALAHIANLSSLERLQLHQTRVTAFGLEKLFNLTNLRTVGLSTPSEFDYKALSGVRSLEELRISSRPFGELSSNLGIEHLALLPNLRRLTFANLDSTGTKTDWSQFPHLEELKITTTNGLSIINQSRIKSVDIRIAGAANRDITLENLPNLEQITFAMGHWSPNKLIIRRVPKLKKLESNWVSVTLEDAPSLEELSVQGWSEGPHGTASLEVKTNLKKLRSVALKAVKLDNETHQMLKVED